MNSVVRIICKAQVFLLIYSTFLSCAEEIRFRQLKKTSEDFVNLYVMRPAVPTLGIWSYTLQIYKYDGHFKNQKTPKLLKEVNIENGEYLFLRLQTGYYKLSIKQFSDSARIVRFEKNTEAFLHFYIFAESYFSKSEIFLKNVTKEEALSILLEHNHLLKNKSSED